ncbi:MAG TPA: Druantia anti-phage system protein DruA [Candidatus Sulfotelmatobacter sp.]|nr:Druantia anti-phage system protein DruA [Candidatus Sulfotelmatobacter sp.]
MQARWHYRQRVITDADLRFVRQLIAEHPQASRRELSYLLCEAWNWVQPNGTQRDMVCRGLMLQLHREGYIELPPVRRQPPNPFAERQKPRMVPVDTQPLQGRLAELRPQLEFRSVRRTSEEPLFNSLIEQYHYLGYKQPVGEHLKFLVYAGERPVACFGWCSSAHYLGCRDRFLGWSDEARRKNIHLLAYNPRFLLLPWVECRYLASHLLARMTGMLSAEWERVYGHPIYFVETFIDRERYRGTCYRAANWVVLGRTTGRGKNAWSKKPNRPIKEVLGYPLTPRFCELLATV